MRRAQPESRLQRSIVEYLRLSGFFVAHIPNGSRLSGTQQQRERTGARLKAEGVVAGFPDLFVADFGGRSGFLEVKAATGRQQETQKECQHQLERRGILYTVVRSIEDVDAALMEWGWHTARERAA